MPTDTPTFTVGNTYTTRFACDADSHLAYTVIKRTAKFITIEDHHGDTVRVGVKTDDQGEWALPQGSYSMAPVIRAEFDTRPHEDEFSDECLLALHESCTDHVSPIVHSPYMCGCECHD